MLHPEDPTFVTSSVMSSRVATAPSSAVNSGMNTPRTMSRRNSTTTFSTTLGLAKMLNERGIKGVTASCVTTPSNERNYTPTATPYNSPDGTPPHSRSTSPNRIKKHTSLKSSASNDESNTSMDYSFGLFSTGAELLKRTFSAESTPTSSAVSQQKRKRKPALSRSDKKALTSIRLVEKLERIGIDTIMATAGSSSMSSLTLQGALCTRRSIESPMAQLTFLKSSISSASSDSLSTSRGKLKDTKDNGNSNTNRGTLSRGQSSRRRGGGNGATRPDLGQVNSAVNVPVTKESTTQSALGTISSLLFGRKGGLL